MDKKTYSKTITKVKKNGRIEQQTFVIETEKTFPLTVLFACAKYIF